jgi:hypothetical protein
MDLISHRIREFNLHISKFLEGQLTAEQASVVVAMANAQHKWVSTAISLYQISKQGGINSKKLKALENKNIYDEQTAADLGIGDVEKDEVRCPILEKFITRAECLDYSGNHYDDCGDCKVGKVTRDKLCPIPAHYPQVKE